jgi:histidine triad (HIT) family protein
MSECLFCQIVEGHVPSSQVAESAHAYAFRDINPHAPVHVLVVPRAHVTSADDLSGTDAALVGEMILLAQEVADIEGIRESGYRLVLNVGEHARMSVPHLHLHVLGGQMLPGRLG